MPDETGLRVIEGSNNNEEDAISSTKSRKTRKVCQWQQTKFPMETYRYDPRQRSRIECWSLCSHKKKYLVLYWKIYFTTEVYELIRVETIRYAHLNEKHNFDIIVEELKSFMIILILSGYSPLPRYSMYWEYDEDTRNAVVSSLMPRNRINSIMPNLHLADNTNLD